VTSDLDLKVAVFFKSNMSKTVPDRAIVTIRYDTIDEINVDSKAEYTA